MESIFLSSLYDINTMYQNKEITATEAVDIIHHTVDVFVENFMDEDVYSESDGIIKTPANRLKEKLAQLRRGKPDEETPQFYVKKFVDDSYKDIMVCTEFLQKENKKLTRETVITCMSSMLSIIGLYVSIGVMALNPVVGLAMAAISAIVFTVLGCIHPIIQFIRASDDTQAMRELTKIKSGLNKAYSNKKIDKDTRKKIKSLITEIEDAETEFYSKVKGIREAVEESMLDYYNDIMDDLAYKVEHGEIDIEDADHCEALVSSILFS